jgi:uncharacterized protein YraI
MRLILICLLLMLAIVKESVAATAFAPGQTNLRAGPGVDYPVVARIAAGSGVQVLGCLERRPWCDSTVQGVRGWVHADRLEFLSDGVRVPYRSARVRQPVVTFDLGYWDQYYRDRPFFRQRPGRGQEGQVGLSAEPPACTRDAMVCPDGSTVGRTGPDCAFRCPGDR